MDCYDTKQCDTGDCGDCRIGKEVGFPQRKDQLCAESWCSALGDIHGGDCNSCPLYAKKERIAELTTDLQQALARNTDLSAEVERLKVEYGSYRDAAESAYQTQERGNTALRAEIADLKKDGSSLDKSLQISGLKRQVLDLSAEVERLKGELAEAIKLKDDWKRTCLLAQESVHQRDEVNRVLGEERDAALADCEKLNKMLRESQGGQGPIDAYVAQCEELDRALATIEAVRELVDVGVFEDPVGGE